MIGIIGGSGVYDIPWLENAVELIAENEYGEAKLKKGHVGSLEVVFLARHGKTHSIQPASINYRSNIKALYNSGVRNIFSTYAVGGINPKYRPGDFAIIGQFIDFTWGRNGTFHDKPGSVVHTDMSEPYSKKLSEVLKNSLQQLGQNFYENQVYICTQGPRFETPAEIKAYSIIGADIVGMTGCPEVALAREFGINFASLAVITNLAAGVSTALISHQEVLDIFNARMEIISEVLRLSCLGLSTI